MLNKCNETKSLNVLLVNWNLPPYSTRESIFFIGEPWIIEIMRKLCFEKLGSTWKIFGEYWISIWGRGKVGKVIENWKQLEKISFDSHFLKVRKKNVWPKWEFISDIFISMERQEHIFNAKILVKTLTSSEENQHKKIFHTDKFLRLPYFQRKI